MLNPSDSIPPQVTMAMPALGERIRARRIGKCWSIIEASCRADIPASTWQQIERGELGPTAWQTTRIAAILDTSIATLLRDARGSSQTLHALPLAS
jgi:transcriptional regulator with XRE-family HTH domain